MASSKARLEQLLDQSWGIFARVKHSIKIVLLSEQYARFLRGMSNYGGGWSRGIQGTSSRAVVLACGHVRAFPSDFPFFQLSDFKPSPSPGSLHIFSGATGQHPKLSC